MLKLFGRSERRWDAEPLVLKLSTERESRCGMVLLGEPGTPSVPVQFARESHNPQDKGPCVVLPCELSHLGEGDIIRLVPRTGDISVLYRKASTSNAIFLTERCNCRCVMCSQPPRDTPDDHLVDAYLAAIPHMDVGTESIGITGGEPTLLGDRLLRVLHACKEHLPTTAVHMLSNGRLFNYQSLCREVAEIEHPNLMVGVPLHSDIASRHDLVAQARGAFDQTVRGMMNLKRFGQRVEIRVVIHRLTCERLPQLARFICRNLPFADQVCLMGMEPIGHAKSNMRALWVDPVDYASELKAAVDELLLGQMNVLIYNHQLCVLDRELWPFACRSISDWKAEYLDVCATCVAKEDCGGFFSSSRSHHSRGIKPLMEMPDAAEVFAKC